MPDTLIKKFSVGQNLVSVLWYFSATFDRIKKQTAQLSSRHLLAVQSIQVDIMNLDHHCFYKAVLSLSLTFCTKILPCSHHCRSWSQGWWENGQCNEQCCCAQEKEDFSVQQFSNPSSRDLWSFHLEAAHNLLCGWRQLVSCVLVVHSNQLLNICSKTLTQIGSALGSF